MATRLISLPTPPPPRPSPRQVIVISRARAAALSADILSQNGISSPHSAGLLDEPLNLPADLAGTHQPLIADSEEEVGQPPEAVGGGSSSGSSSNGSANGTAGSGGNSAPAKL